MKKSQYKSAYSEKLRDPRWQKMRLKIMERDEFHCVQCGDGENTLNVHHCFYKSGCDPWRYPEESLVTLCEKCHEFETEFNDSAKSDLGAILSSRGLLSDDIKSIATGFYQCGFLYRDYESSAIGWALANDDVMAIIHAKYEQHIREVRLNGKNKDN